MRSTTHPLKKKSFLPFWIFNDGHRPLFWKNETSTDYVVRCFASSGEALLARRFQEARFRLQELLFSSLCRGDIMMKVHAVAGSGF
ncbi:NACHT domain-containing protein [Sesbania bispinosa]|nr:NACHT domain-containing protein [Sesbania bispinosa]